MSRDTLYTSRAPECVALEPRSRSRHERVDPIRSRLDCGNLASSQSAPALDVSPWN